MNNLEKAREKINIIDEQMAALFEQRMEAAKEIADYKCKHGLPVFDQKREEEVVQKNCMLIADEAVQEQYIVFLRSVMSVSKLYQARLLSGTQVAYCGIAGAFAQIAAKRIYPTAELISYNSFEDAYHAVEKGDCHCVVLPIENSSAGEVGRVVDLLFSGTLFVSSVYDLSVRHHLVARPGTSVSDIHSVYSHPQALEQCAGFIRKHGLTAVSCENTALAARTVAESGDGTVAAIASEETAALYGLTVLCSNINESAWNTTRFAVLTRAQSRSEETFGLRTLMFFSVNHKAGALAAAMQIIGHCGFNMLSIRSRAFPELLWQYYFAVELEGNVYTQQGEEMLRELGAICDHLKVVGVYPNDRPLDGFEEE